ncbi:Uma2 family endonuclease, partial [Kitasatospora sp. NPDC058263]
RWAAWGALARAVAGLAGELPAGRGTVLAQAVVDFPSARYGYAPDVALVAPGARPGTGGRYGWRDLEAVLEAVPRGQQDEDFVRKHRFYAECGIPLYVLVDPAEAVCTVYSAPQPAGTYREAERVPFGNDLFLPLAGRTLVLRTDDFPVESPTPGAEPGGGRGIVDG